MQPAIRIVPTTRPKSDQTADARGGAQRELWKLLDALALCRRHYNLTPNSLSVLRALISFLPKATPADGVSLVVWPSNRSLSERADGMDERTLRRHLDRLVKAGLIERRSSSNGKRFALRHQSAIVAAFGFELRLLRDNAEDITETARLVRSQNEQSAALRVEILNLLHAPHQNTQRLGATEAEIRKMLRRQSDPRVLSEARDKLRAMHPRTSPPAEEMTACDRQIDRHQQKTEEDSYESVCTQAGLALSPIEATEPQRAMPPPCETDISLDDCLRATTESRAFVQEPVRSWSDLVCLADTLAPMIGIERELAEHAKRAMGPIQAAISILCVIQRSRHIRHPAAYLRRLAALAESGRYSLKSLIRSSLQEQFTTANHIFA